MTNWPEGGSAPLRKPTRVDTEAIIRCPRCRLLVRNYNLRFNEVEQLEAENASLAAERDELARENAMLKDALATSAKKLRDAPHRERLGDDLEAVERMLSEIRRAATGMHVRDLAETGLIHVASARASLQDPQNEGGGE